MYFYWLLTTDYCLLVHLIYRFGIVLVPDLVYLFAFGRAHVEAVGAVDDDAGCVPDIAIGVDNALRHEHSPGIVLADEEGHDVIESLRVLPVIPHAQLEVRRADEAEEVCLPDVLVRPARHARLGRRDVGHHRVKLCRQLVVTEKFAEPAALVDELAQVPHDDIAYRPACETFR